MDVRSADTTSLAAKTAEIEKTKPLARKPLGLVEELLTTQAPVGTNGNVSRPKDPRERKKHDHPARTPVEQEADEATEEVEEPTTDEGEEHHLLDVKA